MSETATDEGMVAVRVDPVLKAALVAEAQAEDRSMTKQLERILRERYGTLAEARAERGDEAVLVEADGTDGRRAVRAEQGSSKAAAKPIPKTGPTASASTANATRGARKRPEGKGANGIASSPRASKCDHPQHGRKGWKCPGCREMG